MSETVRSSEKDEDDLTRDEIKLSDDDINSKWSVDGKNGDEVVIHCSDSIESLVDIDLTDCSDFSFRVPSVDSSVADCFRLEELISEASLAEDHGEIVRYAETAVQPQVALCCVCRLPSVVIIIVS